MAIGRLCGCHDSVQTTSTDDVGMVKYLPWKLFGSFYASQKLMSGHIGATANSVGKLEILTAEPTSSSCIQCKLEGVLVRLISNLLC